MGCNKGPGDVDMSSYISYATDKVTEPKCHISDPDGVLCVYKKELKDMPKDFFKAYTSYHERMNYASFVANEKIVKDTITAKYWKSKALIADND